MWLRCQMSAVTLSTHTVPNTAGSMQRKYEGDDATLHYTMLHYTTLCYATLQAYPCSEHLSGEDRTRQEQKTQYNGDYG